MSPIFGPMRPAFLILTPACVALGWAVARRSGAHIDLIEAALVLIGAVAAHVSVNALNEFVDFRSGLDFQTRRTPFSGGSGTLPAHPELAPLALATGLISASLVVLIGSYFLVQRGLAVLPVGLLGLVLVLAYTPWLTRQPWLCLVAPGLGFGPCMVMGTEGALTGHYSWLGFVASLVPFFLVSNLLLLNQFPDVEADRNVGRSTLPILLGPRRSAQVYQLFFACAWISLGAAVALGLLPALSLIGVAGLAPALIVVRSLSRHDGVLDNALQTLGFNVVASIATPALVALGIFIGGV